jgi:hypothetical protein
MGNIGKANVGKLQSNVLDVSYDESVCGMVFDYGLRSNAFYGYDTAALNFGDGQVQQINNIDEAVYLGIKEGGIMGGIPYYHIKEFYSYIGKDAAIYVMFANCVDNGSPSFTCIEDFQQKASGKLFQLGIWTEQDLWKSTGGTIGFTALLGEIEARAEILSGIIGKTASALLPMNIVLNANTAHTKADGADSYIMDYRNIPNAINLDFPKLSVILGQNGTDAVHTMQNSDINYSPVGMLGKVLACLCLAPAEESIAYVSKYDLNKNDDFKSAELGFGTLKSSSDDYSPISGMSQYRLNQIANKGYVVPVTYVPKPGAVYFSNDTTLSDGDYCSLSRNRVMHKIRRVVRRALIPYINATFYLETTTGDITETGKAQIVNDVLSLIDTAMVNPLGYKQIDGRNVSVSANGNIIETDSINIKTDVVPADSSTAITALETFEV